MGLPIELHDPGGLEANFYATKEVTLTGWMVGSEKEREKWEKVVVTRIFPRTEALFNMVILWIIIS